MEFLDLTIRELHNELLKKTVTPLDLVKEAILRAKADNNNAFEYIMEKEALDLAIKLKEPEADNIFWGIPFVIKDNFSTKDVPTTASSNILNGYVPVFDATVVRKLMDAKAIPIAKTTLDELAMGGSGTTGHLGTTFNPYDKQHENIIGGSSCGSAASVAASIVPFALGSDTGDSVRKPASYAGLVGFKPTWGRISRLGLFPFATSLDHVGYFTRSVFDAALLLNLLAGRDLEDSTSSDVPVDDYTKLLNTDIKGAKIAIIKEIVDSIYDKSINAAFQKTISSLKIRGAKVEYVSIDRKLLGALFPTYVVISCAEATSNNANLDGIKFGPYHQGNTYEEVMNKARSKGFSELIKRRFVIGSFCLMRENQEVLFLRAQKVRKMIVEKVNDIFKDYDAIFLPASPTTAPKLGEASDRLSDEYLIADNHMVVGNFGGFPSITLPLGFKKNLPFGGNLTAKPFNEAKLLQIANVIEDITGFYNLSVRNKKI
ncbi:MAG: amidase family protein [Bacilli bacterium]|jgi:aspartyl-tRNA(Asn)/glutamyl-tRNA(Gln) amidotransferase subunit A